MRGRSCCRSPRATGLISALGRRGEGLAALSSERTLAHATITQRYDLELREGIRILEAPEDRVTLRAEGSSVATVGQHPSTVGASLTRCSCFEFISDGETLDRYFVFSEDDDVPVTVVLDFFVKHGKNGSGPNSSYAERAPSAFCGK